MRRAPLDIGQHQKQRRNRFVRSFFIAGAAVPLALMIFGWLTRTVNVGGNTGGHTAIGQWAFLWIIWPTWILMLDAEHAWTTVFMLLLSASLNSLWYAVMALICWYIGGNLKLFWSGRR